MKITKKLILLVIPAILLLSSCEVFKGGNHCDCPKFSQSAPESSSGQVHS